MVGQMSFWQLVLFLYFGGNGLWLKFAVIWKFFRLWALCDGIEPVENMRKDMFSTMHSYSLSEFWRGWHFSFQRWIIKYVYIPLGGRKFRFLNVWIVFGFAAFWHDIQRNLWIWGGLNAAHLFVEWSFKVWWARRKVPDVVGAVVGGVAGAMSILSMSVINLVAMLDGFTLIERGSELRPTFGEVAFMCSYLFSSVQVVFGIETFSDVKALEMKKVEEARDVEGAAE